MENEKSAVIPKAIIYCRVSTPKQKIEGSGLESQEHRCRQYAELNGYEVEAVFPDDASGGGDFMNRPGMVALLSYLDAQPGKSYVVIFDDLKRFARDTEFHIKLRREFQRRGVRIECLNIKLEDSPEGKFVEVVVAATGELEREQNRRQVMQKMKARVERGYWVFSPPEGYKYAAERGHGKILVRVEPTASILCEALEAFASGHLQSLGEFKRFLETKPAFRKDLPTGEIHWQRAQRLLSHLIYAGYIEAPKWGVSLRKGHHEAIISLETFYRIQERLNENARAPARKDISEDFPLRGFLLCDDCGQPMTSCWSKGRSKHYPYYLCDTRGCESSRKSIPREKIEGGFAEVLRSLQPTREFFNVAKTMLTDAWEMRFTEAHRDKEEVENQLRGVDKQIQRVLERIIETGNATVIKAYEEKIDKLEREKLLLAEKVSRIVPPKGKLEEFIEPALALLANPWNTYDNGNLVFKRAVLRLIFAEPARYSPKSGYRTANTTFPFKVLANISISSAQMVRPTGLDLDKFINDFNVMSSPKT
ncbi:recombinase family protein [Pararhizobium sp. BT-229]|uniref:recombinase family protein n=1 Tax=Pararhizobium sp. BT-229 TaxID=2986923 RepID=UPI0021F7CA8D|nr:recombinase family protein [Pararhizobium sp. BT-229]MCV9960288.1 recombinase family protein [Pararhizobium sp. BT-229]